MVGNALLAAWVAEAPGEAEAETGAGGMGKPMARAAVEGGVVGEADDVAFPVAVVAVVAPGGHCAMAAIVTGSQDIPSHASCECTHRHRLSQRDPRHKGGGLRTSGRSCAPCPHTCRNDRALGLVTAFHSGRLPRPCSACPCSIECPQVAGRVKATMAPSLSAGIRPTKLPPRPRLRTVQ